MNAEGSKGPQDMLSEPEGQLRVGWLIQISFFVYLSSFSVALSSSVRLHLISSLALACKTLSMHRLTLTSVETRKHERAFICSRCVSSHIELGCMCVCVCVCVFIYKQTERVWLILQEGIDSWLIPTFYMINIYAVCATLFFSRERNCCLFNKTIIHISIITI